MKGNKTLTYGLMTVVFLVWGIIFYRVFDGMSGGDDNFSGIPNAKPLPEQIPTETDTFELIADYRDPFLSGITRSSYSGGGNYPATNTIQVAPVKVKKEPKAKEPPVQIDWTFIEYLGLINNKEKNKKVGLVSIFQKEYMVNEGEMVGNVKILRKERDSIHVEFQGNKKWVKR